MATVYRFVGSSALDLEKVCVWLGAVAGADTTSGSVHCLRHHYVTAYVTTTSARRRRACSNTHVRPPQTMQSYATQDGIKHIEDKSVAWWCSHLMAVVVNLCLCFEASTSSTPVAPLWGREEYQPLNDDTRRCYTLLMTDTLKAAWLRLHLIAVVMKTLTCSCMCGTSRIL